MSVEPHLIYARLILMLASGLIAACAERPEAEALAPSSDARFAEFRSLTDDELDAIHLQVQRCWNPPIGTPDVESMIVELRVLVDPDG
ncbi:MAG: hypothetical protein QNJ06_20650 [Kiloniellales bacterium]|nr:hypothetical protein [Kiloniellales bacterium]